MTNTITFDTHQFIKHLIEAGFTPHQAEALSEEQVKLIDNNLATKSDIAQLRADIEKTIRVTIEETKSSLIKWTVTVMGIYSAIIISILAIIINSLH